ncbi:uncharacterized protein [Macrobrachium rosenbergii]|uniref:uncharacterized protein n=1 Tax=Macrobrachium rosenbergii TaxID=79674 RepID=UPI0034D5807D
MHQVKNAVLAVVRGVEKTSQRSAPIRGCVLATVNGPQVLMLGDSCNIHSRQIKGINKILRKTEGQDGLGCSNCLGDSSPRVKGKVLRLPFVIGPQQIDVCRGRIEYHWPN